MNKNTDRPNVILIYADDLGWGDLGCYGATDIQTPNIDKLSENGLRFTDAYSTSPVCTPARFSLMCGKYPSRREGVKILPGDAKCIIREDEMTLPRVFKEAGYTTGIVGKWHLGLGDGDKPTDWNKPVYHTPLDLGFDKCFIFPATADRVPCVYFDGRNVVNLDKNDPIEVVYSKNNPFPELPTGKDNPELLKMKSCHGHDNSIINGVGRIGFMRGGKSAVWKDEDLAEAFSKRAIEFIEENSDKPFFLYYAVHQPHVPRVPSEKFKNKTPLGARGDVIAELDYYVGELTAALERNGLTEKTMIILSSDNGPVLNDGYDDDAFELNREHRPAGPFRGGKYSKFEGGIRIPLIVSYKGNVPRGVSGALISQVDFLKSFASHFGIEVDGTDSMDMYSALVGEDLHGRDEIYAESPRFSRILRQGKWVYLEPDDSTPFIRTVQIETGASLDEQLYNLEYDRGQRANLAYKYPDTVKKMKARAKEIAEQNIN